jgi:LPXTG-motif cell wall-anchored protein
MASSNQGGSILSFLIIGGVLAALFVGGTYLVQQRAARSETVQTPVAQPANQSEDKTPAAEDKKAATKTEPKAEVKQTAPQPAPQSTAPATTELPKTGPAQMLGSIIGLGLLSGTTIAYVRSRRTNVTL